MKKLFLSSFIFFLSISAFCQYILQDGYIVLEKNTKIENSFTFKNLRLYPLLGEEKFVSAHKNIGEYTNLKDALESGKVKIFEVGSEDTIREIPNQHRDLNQHENQMQQEVIDEPVQQVQVQQSDIQQQNNIMQIQQNSLSNGEVNKLQIQNFSADTIYLMAGEIVMGGKQDRILAKDMLIPPYSGKIDLEVFCVEHGRWSYHTSESQSFDQYYNVSSNDVRYMASKEKSQSKVWESVSKITNELNAETESGTYTALNNSEEYREALKEYQEFFKNSFSELNNCIGFVGVTGDKIIGCDIFATPALFNNQFENLISAYITEAITNGKEITIGHSQVENYLKEFLSNETTQDQAIDSKGVQFEHNNKKLHINTY